MKGEQECVCWAYRDNHGQEHLTAFLGVFFFLRSLVLQQLLHIYFDMMSNALRILKETKIVNICTHDICMYNEGLTWPWCKIMVCF